MAVYVIESVRLATIAMVWPRAAGHTKNREAETQDDVRNGYKRVGIRTIGGLPAMSLAALA
jgi:hypothetical protein